MKSNLNRVGWGRNALSLYWAWTILVLAVGDVVGQRPGSESPNPIPKESEYFLHPEQEQSVPPSSPQALPSLFRGSATTTWLASGGDDGLGVTSVNVRGTLFGAIPYTKSPLMVSPSFGVTFLDGPKAIDVPSEVYNVSLNLMYVKQINPRLQLMAGLSPGLATDFNNVDSGAFRFVAHAVGTWQYSQTTQIMFGVVYLGRNDLPILPMAGAIWTPTPDWRVEVTAPRPRVARRVYWFDRHGSSDWVYFAGELGGGTWAVERASGLSDELTLRDFRVLLGWERKVGKQTRAHLEIGYVFGRTIEYTDDDMDFDPSNTLLLRAGFGF